MKRRISLKVAEFLEARTRGSGRPEIFFLVIPVSFCFSGSERPRKTFSQLFSGSERPSLKNANFTYLQSQSSGHRSSRQNTVRYCVNLVTFAPRINRCAFDATVSLESREHERFWSGARIQSLDNLFYLNFHFLILTRHQGSKRLFVRWQIPFSWLCHEKKVEICLQIVRNEKIRKIQKSNDRGTGFFACWQNITSGMHILNSDLAKGPFASERSKSYIVGPSLSGLCSVTKGDISRICKTLIW